MLSNVLDAHTRKSPRSYVTSVLGAVFSRGFSRPQSQGEHVQVLILRFQPLRRAQPAVEQFRGHFDPAFGNDLHVIEPRFPDRLQIIRPRDCSRNTTDPFDSRISGRFEASYLHCCLVRRRLCFESSRSSIRNTNGRRAGKARTKKLAAMLGPDSAQLVATSSYRTCRNAQDARRWFCLVAGSQKRMQRTP